MINRRLYYWFCLGVVLLVTGLVTLTSCSAYKTFTLEKGIAHFTFEYPSKYKVGKVEIRSDLGYTDVSLTGPGPTLEKGGMDHTFISIFVQDNRGSPNAESTTESTLASANRLPDFQLLDQSTLSVLGVTAHQIIYYYNRALPDYNDPEPEPLPTILRDVYFDNNGLFWILGIRSNQAVVEEANAIFEYMLETFKILD